MRILLVSSNAEDKEFFGSAAGTAGLPIVTAPTFQQVADELKRDPAALLVIDASTEQQYVDFEKCLAEKIGLFSDIINTNSIFYVSTCAFHEAPYLVKSDIFGHFIHRSFTEEDEAVVARLFKMAASSRAFGIGNYFPPDARKQSIQISQSLQKKAVVESLKNHLVQLGFKARMAVSIATATDELIMNAIFDAPVNELGKYIYAQTPRNVAMELTGKDVVEMTIVFDGNILGISVIDNHGSLDKKKLLTQHLGKSYESHEYEAKPLTAGAGIGLGQVFRNCGGIIFSCETGGRTEVSIFYKKVESFKDFKDQFRFLSTFMYFS